jgi:hypothetical protein
MFCTECGGEVSSEWKHCPKCGCQVKKSSTKSSEPTSSRNTNNWDDLPEPTYSHWLAVGKPDLIFKEGELLAFDLPEDSLEFWRFAFWILNDVDSYKEWFDDGSKLLHRYFDFDLPEVPAGTELLSSPRITQLLNPAELEIWHSIGKPKLYGLPDGRWVFVEKIDAYNWSQAVNPIPDDILIVDSAQAVAKAKKFLAGPKTKKKKDKVVHLTTDNEVRQYADRDSFKLWKKRGRPSVIVVNGEAMYEIQYRFLELHGFAMSGELLEVWFWSGCPELKYWNYELAMQSYYETYQAAIGALQVRNQGFGGVIEALSSGIAQVGNQIASNANNQRSQMCMRCGRQVDFGQASPNGCAFCLMQR